MSDNRLREVRLGKGLSQLQLSRLSQVSNGLISDFERAQRRAWPKARKALAEALGLPEDEVFPSNGDRRR